VSIEWRRGLAPATAFAAVTVLCWPAAVRAEEDEPSIEEMLAKIEDRLGAESAAKEVAAAPVPAEEEAGRKLPSDFEKTPAVTKTKRTIDFGPLLKRLETRTRESAEYYRRAGEQRDMVRVQIRSEAFDKAGAVLGRLVKHRKPVDQWGWVEAEYACVMACVGNDRAAAQYVGMSEKLLEAALSGRRVPNKNNVAWLKGRHAFVKGYPEARKKLHELTSSLATGPDADKQWELVKLCDPEHGEAKLPVKWLVAIHEMQVLYPDDERNRDGASDRELARAYTHHEMFEECIAHVAEVLKEGPKTVKYVAEGSAAWDHAYAHERLGRHLRHMYDKRALATYQEAIKLYKAIKEDYPESWYNDSRRRTSPVDRGIERAEDGMSRVRR
jgi:hypothetical protein